MDNVRNVSIGQKATIFTFKLTFKPFHLQTHNIRYRRVVEKNKYFNLY
jgi:hypothetical protein